MSIAQKTYDLTAHFPNGELYGIVSQMRRCAVSIPSNIAEGSQRGTKNDFKQFISIARGSLAELETQLILSVQLRFASDESSQSLSTDIAELKKMLYAFQQTLLPS